MRNKRSEDWARHTARKIRDFLANRKVLDDDGNAPVGIILGTGFGNKLNLDDAREFPLRDFESFREFSILHLPPIEGHARKYIAGRIEGKSVIALSGRIHLNENPDNPDIHRLVRLQIDTLLQLGVKKLILTCAAGALPNTGLQVGNLVVIDGFVTLFAPQMPLWAGEFVSPEDTLSKQLQKIARKVGEKYPGRIKKGGYAMVIGPHFEGRKYDKMALRNTGASIVGMSVLPEACIAALYPGVEVLALAFITNDAEEVHSHEENMKRAQKFAEPLSSFLTEVIKNC